MKIDFVIPWTFDVWSVFNEIVCSEVTIRMLAMEQVCIDWLIVGLKKVMGAFKETKVQNVWPV